MARPIDADKLLDDITAIKNSSGMGYIIASTFKWYVNQQPTITTPTVGRCKDCDNWDEELSSGRKSLNNYVCTCNEWCNPEVGFYRSTSPNDYCSYFEPKEALKDGL